MNGKKAIFSLLVLALLGIYGVFVPLESGSFQQENGEIQKVIVTSVFDNYQINPELQTGWGFGTVIQTPEEMVLFDTGGNAEILLSNMAALHIAPQSIDTVIISHVHSDHVGGLEGFLDKNSQVMVFIPASFPHAIRNMITSKGAQFVDVSGARKISEGIFSTGELYGPPKEQSLVIHTPKGLIVMTGCGHPGIVSIVKKAKALFPETKVYLAMGGFHHPPIEAVQGLRALGVEKVAPSHCTGDQVIEAFRREYQHDFIPYGVGKIIEIK